MLAGINAHDELNESWVFKGGTCLKKCYFETYRFSEDLDFTLRNEAHLDEEFLRTAFEQVIAWVTEQSGLNIPADQLEFDIYDNAHGRPKARASLYPTRGISSVRRPTRRRDLGELPKWLLVGSQANTRCRRQGPMPPIRHSARARLVGALSGECQPFQRAR
jgi:Nucleotidyl transferase AbiEii toxin, Type IV TA system